MSDLQAKKDVAVGDRQSSSSSMVLDGPSPLRKMISVASIAAGIQFGWVLQAGSNILKAASLEKKRGLISSFDEPPASPNCFNSLSSRLLISSHATDQLAQVWFWKEEEELVIANPSFQIWVHSKAVAAKVIHKLNQFNHKTSNSFKIETSHTKINNNNT
ncbi:unnamed protein product [Arabidopsis lyrata]|nr:unnamed protein product [Arabidopsis lyrata]